MLRASIYESVGGGDLMMAPRLPQMLQMKLASTSESRTSSGHCSTVAAGSLTLWEQW
jgi:hypothetical protein